MSAANRPVLTILKIHFTSVKNATILASIFPNVSPTSSKNHYNKNSVTDTRYLFTFLHQLEMDEIGHWQEHPSAGRRKLCRCPTLCYDTSLNIILSIKTENTASKLIITSVIALIRKKH
jgi:hypothetical protein